MPRPIAAVWAIILPDGAICSSPTISSEGGTVTFQAAGDAWQLWRRNTTTPPFKDVSDGPPAT